MRIMNYPKTSEVVKGSTFLNVDSAAAGTKAIEADDLRKEFIKFTTKDEYYDFLDAIGIDVAYRRNIFRGKSLGSSYTSEQKARIADGTFKGFFIGDYWEINGIKYRIADINYWLGTGDTECTTPHLVIVPDSGIGSPQKMNDTNTTDGGYLACKWRAAYASTATGTIFSAFGQSSILNYKELLVNAVTNGYPSAGTWLMTTVELMNEPMVYGSYQITPGSNGTVISYRYTIDKTQLSLFKLHPEFIVAKKNGQRESYWLRDVVSAANFANVNGYGYSTNYYASTALAARPVFGIIG